MSYANFITTLKEIPLSEKDRIVFEERQNKDLIGKKSIEFCYEVTNGQRFSPLYRPRIGRVYPSLAKKVQEEKNKFVDVIKKLNGNYDVTKILFVLFENEEPAIETVKMNFDEFTKRVIDDTILINTIYKIERDYKDF